MNTVFVPMVLACMAVVENPSEDCVAFKGNLFDKKEECTFNLYSQGLPLVEQALPEGGTISDYGCIEFKSPKGATAKK